MSQQLSKNIWRYEVACQCGCGFDTIDTETIGVVQECCDYFANHLDINRVYLTITSGARCSSHNEKVGGSKNSQHLYARAIDFRIRGISPEDVLKYLLNKYPDLYGIGDYGTFTHLDTRTGSPARW